MLVPRLEKKLGIEAYATRSAGIGGVLRQKFEDFRVEEVLVDGSQANIDEGQTSAASSSLGSSLAPSRHLLCVLIKRNWDTLSATKAVADQLGVSVVRVHAAGMKDARAVTAQHITIEDVSIQSVNRIRLKDLELRPIGYVREELSSFYLLGNRFQVVIRSIDHSKTSPERRVRCVVRDLQAFGGVPNFFGHQRFGTIRPVTHLIGKQIVKGNFEKAVMLFLTATSSYEHPDSRKAREELLLSGDFRKAKVRFPKQLRYEHLILGHLTANPHDFVGALKKLPFNLQRLLVQAYQSFLFNRFLSARIVHDFRLDEPHIGDYAVSLQRNGLPLIAMPRTVREDNLSNINSAIKTGKMKVALPLIGFKQTISGGTQGIIEAEILEKEEIRHSDFRIAKIPEISSRGEVRTALASLDEFSVQHSPIPASERSATEVRLGFMLPRGSYATALLREIMKPFDLIKAGY